jgi:hypothetical protein
MNQRFTFEQAEKLGDQLGVRWGAFSAEDLRRGMEVELEHGKASPQTNVTNDDALTTAKIALAHLNEMPNYYDLLEVMESEAKGQPPFKHYYGDRVRGLFLFGGASMLIGLPFVSATLNIPPLLSVAAILGLGLLAGLTSPKNPWISRVNWFVSIVAFFIFEFYAVRFFTSRNEYMFVINEFLALIFLSAIYYSTKTVRGVIKI